MPTLYAVDPPILGVDFTATYSDAKYTEFKVGQIVSTNAGDYMFVKNNTGGATTAYDVLIIDHQGYLTAGVTQTNDDGAPLQVGIPQAAITSAYFGWAFVGGSGDGTATCSVNVLANCAIDVPLYTTATAGKLDDATASAKLVSGLKLTTANGGSTAACPAMATGRLQILS